MKQVGAARDGAPRVVVYFSNVNKYILQSVYRMRKVVGEMDRDPLLARCWWESVRNLGNERVSRRRNWKKKPIKGAINATVSFYS